MDDLNLIKSNGLGQSGVLLPRPLELKKNLDIGLKKILYSQVNVEWGTYLGSDARAEFRSTANIDAIILEQY
jgi:hypothetical protein